MADSKQEEAHKKKLPTIKQKSQKETRLVTTIWKINQLTIIKLHNIAERHKRYNVYHKIISKTQGNENRQALKAT